MSTATQPLRVIGLQIRNVMGVKAIDIEPDPDDSLVIIGGDNGAGKTSTIDSIWWAIGGKPNVLKPIRAGEQEASIELDLGDIKVVRRFWNNANTGKLETSLKVTTADGAANYSRPQEVLDALLSKFAFDPFEFTRTKPKDQVDRLKAVLGIDTTEIEDKRRLAYDERTLINRQLDSLKAKFDGSGFDEDAPTEEISVSAITEELGKAHEHNRIADQKARDAEKAAEGLRLADTMIAAQQNRIDAIKQELWDEETKLADMAGKRPEIEKAAVSAQKIAGAMKRIDVDPIEERLDSAEEINRRVRANASLVTARKEWEEIEAKRVALNRTLDECAAAKTDMVAKAIASAKMAVEGLDLDEEALWINGIPFNQCNDALKLKVSVALAVYENPRLRVYRIKDGEKLTPPSMQMIREIAADAGAQIMVEFACMAEDVANGYREVSFFINEGELGAPLAVAS